MHKNYTKSALEIYYDSINHVCIQVGLSAVLLTVTDDHCNRGSSVADLSKRELDDTKEVRGHKQRKDRQYNGRKNKTINNDLQNNTK